MCVGGARRRVAARPQPGGRLPFRWGGGPMNTGGMSHLCGVNALGAIPTAHETRESLTTIYDSPRTHTHTWLWAFDSEGLGADAVAPSVAPLTLRVYQPWALLLACSRRGAWAAKSWVVDGPQLRRPPEASRVRSHCRQTQVFDHPSRHTLLPTPYALIVPGGRPGAAWPAASRAATDRRHDDCAVGTGTVRGAARGGREGPKARPRGPSAGWASHTERRASGDTGEIPEQGHVRPQSAGHLARSPERGGCAASPDAGASRAQSAIPALSTTLAKAGTAAGGRGLEKLGVCGHLASEGHGLVVVVFVPHRPRPPRPPSQGEGTFLSVGGHGRVVLCAD